MRATEDTRRAGRRSETPAQRPRAATWRWPADGGWSRAGGQRRVDVSAVLGGRLQTLGPVEGRSWPLGTGGTGETMGCGAQ